MNLSPVPSAVPSLSFTKRRIQRNVRKESYRLDKSSAERAFQIIVAEERMCREDAVNSLS